MLFNWFQNLTPPINLSSSAIITYSITSIFLIVILARLLGNLMVRLKQPRVVGEILAGIFLGPTIMGSQLSQVVAPLEIRPVLNVIATLALIMFMFVTGLEYDASKMKGRYLQAGTLAILSVAVPALLGFPIALLMRDSRFVGPAGESFLALGLFIGASLSVSAFPVMAHILMERGELNSPLGSLGIASAGLMSVFMFSYIAFASTMANGSDLLSLLLNYFWIGIFTVVSLFLVRPLLAKILPDLKEGEEANGNTIAFMFGGMVLYGLLAHLLGINALVGGFIWGFLQPNYPYLRRAIAAKVRDAAMVFFLPVFFAIAGFSTDLKMISLSTAPVIAAVLAAAIGGKFLAVLPVRIFGLTWSEATVLGALFNTRGLLVLVVGLIGVQLEVFSTLTFTIIVIVALVTNLLTLPVLNFVAKKKRFGNPVVVLKSDM